MTDGHEYGTFEYYKARALGLEKDRNDANQLADYYRKELAKAHEILGRVTHQLSERWDSVRLTEHFPTDNLASKRSLKNPNGE
jgi:hypothetical protein